MNLTGQMRSMFYERQLSVSGGAARGTDRRQDGHDDSASAEHIYTAGSIYNIFKNYLRGKACVPFSDGLLVHLTDEDKFVPDMMVVCDRSKNKSDGVH